MLTQIKCACSKLKDRIVKYFSSTLLGLAFGQSNPEQWDKLFKKDFEKAKALSDFAGMLMRAAFVFLLFRFFSHMSDKEDFWLYSMSLGMNSWLCFMLYIFLLVRICGIASIYWLKDTSYHGDRLNKVVIIVISVITTISMSYGISVLVRAFVSASNLPH